MRTVEELVEQGIEIPADPVAIAALLEADEAPEKKAPEAPETETPPAKEEPEKPPEKAAVEPEKPPEKPATPETPAATPVEDDPDAEKGPPRAVLRAYRAQLHEKDGELERVQAAAKEREAALEKELAELKGKFATGQDVLQAKADELGTGAILKELTPEKIEELRKEHDDEIVNVISSLSKAAHSLQDKLAEIEGDNKVLVQSKEQLEIQQLVDDIDTVPLLGVLRLDKSQEGDARWERAEAYRKAVRADPDFADKSRREVYAEVGRRMERHLGKDVVKGLVGEPKAAAPAGQQKKSPQEIVAEAVAKADKAGIPTSLSEIPAAGSAVAQDMAQRVDAMSHDDIRTMIDRVIAAGGDVDELIGKLSSRIA